MEESLRAPREGDVDSGGLTRARETERKECVSCDGVKGKNVTERVLYLGFSTERLDFWEVRPVGVRFFRKSGKFADQRPRGAWLAEGHAVEGRASRRPTRYCHNLGPKNLLSR